MDNYDLQVDIARRIFLEYDQQLFNKDKTWNCHVQFQVIYYSCLM